jgi:8-oxo-dGTP pyrophosphatase MutT (NUDIX family)
MPTKHCYCLPWRRVDGEIQVMLAAKNLEQTRVDGHAPRITKRSRDTGKARGDNIIPNYAGQWVIIGGGGEKDEAPAAGCRREFLEETGVALPDRTYRMVTGAEWNCMLVEGAVIGENAAAIVNQNILAGAPPDDELEAAAWYSIAEAREKLTSVALPAEDEATYGRQARKPRDWFVEMISHVSEALPA